MWITIVQLAERYDPPLYQRLMGYPDDLPNLTRLRPPGGNTRPEGIADSTYFRRKNKTLPGTHELRAVFLLQDMARSNSYTSP